MNQIVDKQRILGMIQGCALGDAFGMATEMLSQETISEKIGVILRPIDSLDISMISKNRLAGSITDDTMNTLMLMEMLQETKGIIEMERYLDKLKQWTKQSPFAHFVTGPSTSRALQLIETGVSLEETGKMGTTNGAAMKISPVGIIADYHDVKSLVDLVAVICKPTHHTSIAIQGAAAIASVVSYALRGGDDWDSIWHLVENVVDFAKDYGNPLPSASLNHRIKLAKQIAEESSDQNTFLSRLYIEVGTGLETIEIVPSALAIAYYVGGDPLRCAQLCAIAGGDTDTLGAIATSICGAMHPDQIPLDIIQEIEAVNEISFHEYVVSFHES